MNRRQFITALTAAAPAPLLLRIAPAANAKTIVLQESKLAGFQYHQGEKLWSKLHVGDPLTLTREPNNPYDTSAVRVDWRKHKLGYISRLDNTAAAQLLDRHHHLTAHIARLQTSDNPWDRVLVRIQLRA